MKRKAISAVLALVMIAVLMAGGLLSGCSSGGAGAQPAATGSAADSAAGDANADAASSPDQAAPADTSITVTDMAGREVTLPAPATRVIALTAGDVEIIYALGAGDTLVGRGEYCDYPSEVLDVMSVESGNETNIEQIIALKPQLLVMSQMAQTQDQIRQLEDAGIVTYVSYAQDIEGTYTAISLLGQLLGKSAEADTVISNMKSVFADVHDKAMAASGGEQKSIYFEVSPLEYGLWAAGTGTFMNEIAGLLNMRNIFDDVSSWAEVSEEQVLERNPDYIMTVGMYYGDGPTPVESILARPGWENITAVKNKAVLDLANNELSRPGPRLADGAQMLYDFVYGGGSAS